MDIKFLQLQEDNSLHHEQVNLDFKTIVEEGITK